MTTSFPSSEFAWDPALERALVAAPSPDSFADLVSRLKGRYPAEVLQVLEDRPATADAAGRASMAMIREARRSATRGDLPQGRGLALPHLLDAEWRFTEETADMLVSVAAADTRPGDAILLKGVPSVVLAALRSSHDRKFWVLGEPNVITVGLKAMTGRDRRFRHGAPASLEASAAILDPPWYVQQFRSMLGQAASYCRDGAHLFVSAPAEGVRPGIASDLDMIFRVAAQSGLALLSEHEGALIYRTPAFEVNALRAAGIGTWLPDWRRGNLIHFIKREPGTAWPPTAPVVAFELTLAGIRLRLLPSSLPKAGMLVPICEGEVFPSVSMRAPRRCDANLWTSGNRAFTVDGASALNAMLAIAVDRNLWPDGLDSELSAIRSLAPVDLVRPLIHKLIQLADRELAEAASLVGAAAWERSANDARFLNGSWHAFRANQAGVSD